MTATLLGVYVLMILIGSLFGGLIPHLVRLTHVRMQMMLSLIAGLMLGVSILHLLPHAAQSINVDRAAGWIILGFLTMFFLQRVFAFHVHDHGLGAEVLSDDHPHHHDHSHHHDHDHDHDHDALHRSIPPNLSGHGHPGDHGHKGGQGSLSWAGAMLGLCVHTVIDGLALAGSVVHESDVHGGGGKAWAMYGFGTFLVIVLHKPFDALSIGTLMYRDGWPARTRHWVNALFACMIPVGIGLFFVGESVVSVSRAEFVGCVLAFASGNFLCIALADLLPELQFHSHDRWKLSAMLLLGLGASYGLVFLESSGHDHHHNHAPGTHSTPEGRPPANGLRRPADSPAPR